MTLDEAIQRCDENAREQEDNAILWNTHPAFAEKVQECKNCAKEYRQMAGWLRELKLLKALKSRQNTDLGLILPNGTWVSYELFSGCAFCDRHETCMDAFHSNAVNCNAYGKL